MRNQDHFFHDLVLLAIDRQHDFRNPISQLLPRIAIGLKPVVTTSPYLEAVVAGVQKLIPRQSDLSRLLAEIFRR